GNFTVACTRSWSFLSLVHCTTSSLLCSERPNSRIVFSASVLFSDASHLSCAFSLRNSALSTCIASRLLSRSASAAESPCFSLFAGSASFRRLSTVVFCFASVCFILRDAFSSVVVCVSDFHRTTYLLQI